MKPRPSAFAPPCASSPTRSSAANRFLDAAETLVRQSIEECRRDGREHLQVAFGCTGGQHRSVYFAERMAERLRGIDGVDVEVAHAAMPYWKTGATPADNPQAD